MNELQKRMKLLQLLSANGVKTEKELHGLTTDQMLEFNGVTLETIREIKKLKERSAKGQLYSYLITDVKKDESDPTE